MLREESNRLEKTLLRVVLGFSTLPVMTQIWWTSPKTRQDALSSNGYEHFGNPTLGHQGAVEQNWDLVNSDYQVGGSIPRTTSGGCLSWVEQF